MKQLKGIFILLGLFSFFTAFAQRSKIKTPFQEFIAEKTKIDTNCKLLLGSVTIKGNKKTKDYIIFREMKIHEGDSIRASEIFERIKESRDLVYNTNLFSIVELVPLMTSAYEFTITVELIERWYIYPAPQFRLNDRNFNEWYKTYDADFKRVDYGLKFTHYNLSGRSDQLNLIAMTGYSRNFYASYTAPYSNPKLTEGFSFGLNFTQNKEVAINTTTLNKLKFYKSADFNKNNVIFNLSYRKRKGFYNRHLFGLQFNYINVADTIITSENNPDYFNLNQTKIAFFDFSYAFQYINVNNVNYPLKGKAYSLAFVKRGFGLTGGVNLLAIDFAYRKYFSLGRNFYSSIQLLSKIKIPFKQAYINRRAMGYGDFYLNGLEYYVIDGVAAGISKFTLSKKLFSFKMPVPFKIKTLPYIPFSFYAKTYAHAGYNHIPSTLDSRLNNKLLYTGGIGIDMLTLYDLKFSVEFSLNQLGEKGLFLHSGKL